MSAERTCPKRVELIIAETTTLDEILGWGLFGPNRDKCCARFLICCPGGKPSFQCEGCKMPKELVVEAIRRHNIENPPVEGGLVSVYSNW